MILNDVNPRLLNPKQVSTAFLHILKVFWHILIEIFEFFMKFFQIQRNFDNFRGFQTCLFENFFQKLFFSKFWSQTSFWTNFDSFLEFWNILWRTQKFWINISKFTNQDCFIFLSQFRIFKIISIDDVLNRFFLNIFLQFSASKSFSWKCYSCLKLFLTFLTNFESKNMWMFSKLQQVPSNFDGFV